MNIVYLHTHDSGRYWTPYGFPAVMPNTLALASEGLLFRNAFCAAPTCSPSRAALLTGQAAHSCGMLGLAHRGFALADPSRHLSGFLAGHGFETVLCGVQHEASADDGLGYEIRLTKDKCRDMVEWDLQNARLAGEYLKQRHEKPFFLSLGLMNTHRPYPRRPEKESNADFVQPPWTAADTAANRNDMADYYYAAGIADRCFGMVLDGLRQNGLEDNTVILMTTDHGIAWPFMKCTLTDGGIGVGMIMKVPGMHQRFHTTDCLVSQLDVFPTLCDLLHLEKPSWLQGRSMIPVMEENREIREEICAEVNYHSCYEPKRCIRTNRYKLIVRYDDYLNVVAANIDPSPAKDFLREAGYMKGRKAREELYDLWIDPAERVNLIDSPSHAEIYHDLLRRLNDWMKATEDPLLHVRHRIRKPSGARINLRTAYRADEPEYEPADP